MYVRPIQTPWLCVSMAATMTTFKTTTHAKQIPLIVILLNNGVLRQLIVWLLRLIYWVYCQVMRVLVLSPSKLLNANACVQKQRCLVRWNCNSSLGNSTTVMGKPWIDDNSLTTQYTNNTAYIEISLCYQSSRSKGTRAGFSCGNQSA